MKLRFTMKTPDIVEHLVSQFMEETFPPTYDEESGVEVDAFAAEKLEEEKAEAKYRIEELLNKHFQYGECLTMEFDTETETFEVVSKKK